MPIKDPVKRRENHARYMREVWYPKNKQTKQVRARLIVRNEVKAGTMPAPSTKDCESCGGHDNVQAHHEDHDRPLDVNYLCVKCHRDRDAGEASAV